MAALGYLNPVRKILCAQGFPGKIIPKLLDTVTVSRYISIISGIMPERKRKPGYCWSGTGGGAVLACCGAVGALPSKTRRKIPGARIESGLTLTSG